MTKFVHTVTDLGVENEYPKLVRDKLSSAKMGAKLK